MKSIEERRAQFNDAWDRHLLDKAQNILGDLVNLTLDPTQRDHAATHFVYWSKYNDGFDKLLDELIAAQKQKPSDAQHKALQQTSNFEREVNELKQQLERITLATEIETLQGELEQLASQQIADLQSRSTQTTTRVSAREHELETQLSALRQMEAAE